MVAGTRSVLFAIATILGLAGTATAIAQAGAVGGAGPPGEQRVALVVGNSAYAESPLRNPANDANDVAETLRGLGFTVILRTDATRRQMVEGVREFGAQIRRGGVGFFYYAGHGIQSRGRNYLIPVGATLAAEADLEFEAVDANMVLAQMDEANNRVNIVVLDACRDNPFARSFRSSSRGLAQLDAAKGSFLAFATSPGSVASDGDGRNGTYTKHLLASLKDPNTKLEEVFKRVRVGVAQETANRQIPWDSSSVTGDFYFRAPVQAASAAATAAGSRWEGQTDLWHIKAVVANGRAKGIVRCFRQRGDRAWSAWGPTFDVAVGAGGAVDANLFPVTGWTPRRITGSFPSLSIHAEGRVDCPNGTVVLRAID